MIEKFLVFTALSGMALVVGAGMVFLLLVVASVPMSILAFIRTAWFKFQMKRVEQLDISEVGVGSEGRVVGQIATISKPLQAPLSGRACAYFKVVVEIWIGDKYSTYLKILEEECGEDFVLQDSTGQILVTMSEARVLAEGDAFYQSGRFHDATPNLEAFLARHGEKSTNFLGFNKALRYRESILGYNEPIAVTGIGLRRGDELVLGSTKSNPQRISDMAGVV